MASGDLDQLREWTKTAIEDYRDVLSYAEYPKYMKEIGFADVPIELQRAVTDSDWKQYRTWFDRK
jgi:hypothetical protein